MQYPSPLFLEPIARNQGHGLTAFRFASQRGDVPSSKMGKCNQIIHFLNIHRISLENPQANPLHK
jgi:hypothetical protein